MFVGCFDISINVIVKHVQHVRILWAFCLLRGMGFGKFVNVWGIEKIAGLWFARGISTQTDTKPDLTILTSLKSKNVLCQPC